MRIGRARLVAFSMPVLLFQAIETAWRAYMPRFLTLDVGIALGTVGALLLGARLLDAIADPVLGWLSDSVRTPMGLRKPWMALGAVLVPAGALLLFLAPPGAGPARIVGASMLLHLGYTCIVTPHGGWGLELSDDPDQRTRIMGAKIWFGLLGALGLLSVMALLERNLALPRADQMALLGWAIAVLAPLTVLTVLMVFRERARPAAMPGADGPLALFGSILRDPSMRAILSLYVLTGIIEAAAAGSFLFLAEDVLGLMGWGATLLLVQPMLALATLPVWSRVSARIGRQRALMIAYGWQGMIAPLVFLIPDGQPLVLAALLAARGLGWGVDYMLLRAMVADLADGRSPTMPPRAGSCYGVSSVTLKLAMGLGGGGALWLMGRSGPVGADAAIRSAYALPAAILAPVAILLLIGLRTCRQAPHDRRPSANPRSGSAGDDTLSRTAFWCAMPPGPGRTRVLAFLTPRDVPAPPLRAIQNQHRRPITPRAQRRQHRQSVEFGQVSIENDRVIAADDRGSRPVDTCSRMIGCMAKLHRPATDMVRGLHIVFDQQKLRNLGVPVEVSGSGRVPPPGSVRSGLGSRPAWLHGTHSGVPLATWAGKVLRWLTAFAGIACVGGVAMVALRFALPSPPASTDDDMAAELRVLARGPVLAPLALTVVGASAMFTSSPTSSRSCVTRLTPRQRS